MLERRLASEENKKTSGGKIGGKEGVAEPVAAQEPVGFLAQLAQSTQQGGLTALPAGYEGKKGFWKDSILSDNLFEVLFLDYAQYRNITPTMVQQNYDLLLAFWKEKEYDLTSGQRLNVSLVFGSEKVVPDALAALKKAYDKLKTEAGILDYYQTLDTKRYDKGIASISEIVEIVLEDGELTKKEGMRILQKGVANHLTEFEIIKYIEGIIKPRGFKPRALKQHPDFFDNKWMTDDAEKASRGKSTKWLDHEVSSLEEVGEVCFKNKEKAYNRIASPGLLTAVVTQLTGDSEIGYEYQQMLEKENDADKRFLKVIYRLNPALPISINNQNFDNINQLLAGTANSFNTFTAAQRAYGNNHLHIWLNEADAETAKKLPHNTDANGFLTFILKVNAGHGIYLNSEKFNTPQELANKAKLDKAWWHTISEAMQAGVLPVWFAGIGHQDWIEEYNDFMKEVVDNSFYTDEDKKMVSVQWLLEIIDEEVFDPELIVNPESIQLPALEGSKPYIQHIEVNLDGFGFVKAWMGFENDIPGVRINHSEATFFSLAGATSAKFQLEINPFELIKNKPYQYKILLRTEFEEIEIPLEINVIFPKKAFILQLVKYAAFGAALFAGIRYLLTSLNMAFEEQFDSRFEGAYMRPERLYMYFVALLLLVVCLLGSYFIIRKAEKV